MFLENQKLREGIKQYLVTGQLFLNYILKKSLLVDVISLKKCMKTGELKQN